MHANKMVAVSSTHWRPYQISDVKNGNLAGCSDRRALKIFSWFYVSQDHVISALLTVRLILGIVFGLASFHLIFESAICALSTLVFIIKFADRGRFRFQPDYFGIC